MEYPDGHNFGINQIPNAPFISKASIFGLNLVLDFLDAQHIYDKGNNYFRSQLLIPLLPA